MPAKNKEGRIFLLDRAKAQQTGTFWLSLFQEEKLVRDLVGGQDLSNPGGFTIDEGGSVATFNGAQQQNKAIVFPSGFSQGKIIVAARIKATAAQAASPGAAFGIYASAGTQTGIGVGFDASSNVGHAFLDSAAAGLRGYSAGALNTYYTVFAQRLSNQNCYGWINGNPATTSQGAAGGTTNTPDELSIGAQHRSAGYLRQFKGNIEWAALIYLPKAGTSGTDGLMSDEFAKELYESNYPYSLEAKPSRIWVAGAGGLTLSPSLYTDPDTFYSPTVSPGAVTLSPSLFTESDTFYAATVTPGAITLSPALVVDADTFYAATVTGSVNLTPSLLSNSNTFYSPTVSTGSVNISPALFNDADTFYSPTVSLDGSPQTLTPSLFSDADTFHPATVTAGGVTLNPSLFADADTFYIPTVSLDGAPQNLTPSLYVDSDTFYSPVVSSSGSQNLSPSLFVDADIFYPFSMVNGGFAKRGEYENDQSARRMHIQESTRSNIQTSRRR